MSTSWSSRTDLLRATSARTSTWVDPDQVSLVFNRRLRRTGWHPTPGRFRTRVITEGVTPSLHVDYQHTTIKQYHKEGRALRTETTINNTYDFDIGKRLTNLPALFEVGFTANRRLLDVQRLSHNPARGRETFTAINDPVITTQDTRIAGLRFADPRAQALLAIPWNRRDLICWIRAAGFRSLLGAHARSPGSWLAVGHPKTLGSVRGVRINGTTATQNRMSSG